MLNIRIFFMFKLSYFQLVYKDKDGKIIHCPSDYLDTWRELENAVDAGLVKPWF